MINETVTHFFNELTTGIIDAALEPNSNLSIFQILLIVIGLLSVIQSVVVGTFKHGLIGIFYVYGAIKWAYMRVRGKEI